MIGNEILFADLLLTEKGVKPDPARILALSDFPVPKDVTGVRSFLALANQLSGLIPDFITYVGASACFDSQEKCISVALGPSG